MNKYRCVKSFLVEKYDVSGNLTNDYISVEKGDIYELDNGTNYFSGENHLEKDDGLSWIEISTEMLTEFFEVVKHE